MARTQDEEFNLQHNNLLKLEETLTTLQSNVTANLSHWQSTLRSSHEVSGALRSFFERNECPLSTSSLRYEAVHTNMADSKYSMLEKLTNDNILHPLAQFLVQLTDMRRRIKERDTARQAFDHYYTKILKLRAEKETLALKGKYSGKEVEKVTRNEQKFREAQAAYRTINRSVAGEMWLLWKRRWALMEELMSEVVKVEVMFVRALANQLDPMLVEVRKVTTESKAKAGGAEERDRDGREAPFFSAKPPVGLEEYEEEERRKEKGGRKKATGGAASRRGDADVDEYYEEDEEEEQPRPPVRRTMRAESAFEDERQDDEDELEEEQVERKTRPKRRDEVKAAPVPVARRRPAATRAQPADDEYYEDEYREQDEHHEYEQEEVISSADFFAAAAASTAPPAQPQRRPVTRAPPPPTAAPKRVTPAASAPRRPAAAAMGDPFAALEATGNNIDPFFVAAHTSVSASREGAPVSAAPKRRPPAPTVNVDASAVDFFSNAMNVSSSTPVHSAFTTPLAFGEPPMAAMPASKPKQLKKQPSLPSTFNAGLPPLSATSSSAALDDPFAGLPLASSPVHTVADKPAVVDFFSTPAPAASSGNNTPPTSSPSPASGPPSRRPSLPLHTPSTTLRQQAEPVMPAAAPPPPPQPKVGKKRVSAPPPPPVPAADAFEGLDEDEGADLLPPLLSSVQAAHPPPPPPAAAPAPPLPRQPSQRSAAPPPPPPANKAAPPPPPSRSQNVAVPPPPYAAAVPSSSPLPPPGPPRSSPAPPPPPPGTRSTAPPPPPAARAKAGQQPPRRVVAAAPVDDDDEDGPGFEMPDPAAMGDAKDPFAAFNAD